MTTPADDHSAGAVHLMDYPPLPKSNNSQPLARSYSLSTHRHDHLSVRAARQRERPCLHQHPPRRQRTVSGASASVSASSASSSASSSTSAGMTGSPSSSATPPGPSARRRPSFTGRRSYSHRHPSPQARMQVQMQVQLPQSQPAPTPALARHRRESSQATTTTMTTASSAATMSSQQSHRSLHNRSSTSTATSPLVVPVRHAHFRGHRAPQSRKADRDGDQERERGPEGEFERTQSQTRTQAQLGHLSQDRGSRDLLALRATSCALFSGFGARSSSDGDCGNRNIRERDNQRLEAQGNGGQTAAVSDNTSGINMNIDLGSPMTSDDQIQPPQHQAQQPQTQTTAEKSANLFAPQATATTTTIHWTSAATRRREYAAIDAADAGLRGLLRRLMPPCCRPRRKRTPFYRGTDREKEMGGGDEGGDRDENSSGRMRKRNGAGTGRWRRFRGNEPWCCGFLGKGGWLWCADGASEVGSVRRFRIDDGMDED